MSTGLSSSSRYALIGIWAKARTELNVAPVVEPNERGFYVIYCYYIFLLFHLLIDKSAQIVEQQIAELQKSLAVIDYKCVYYQKAVDAGTEQHLRGKDQLPYADAFLNKPQ